MDALTGWAADARILAGAGVRITVDEHARHAKALAGQGAGIDGEVAIAGRADLRGLGQWHPGLQAPEVAGGIGIVRHHHVEHFQQIGHGAGIGHHHVHGRRQRPVAAHRDDPARGGIGAETIVGGRAATAGPGFLGQAEGGEAGRGGGTGAVGRAGGEGRGEVAGVVGAFGAPVNATLHAAVGHGRHVGLAQADGASGAQPFDGEGVALGDQVLERRTAGGGGQPLHQIAVLGGVGDAIQRPQGLTPGAAAVGLGGFGQGIGIAHHHGIERGGAGGGVVGIDTGQVGLDQLHRSGLAGFECATQLGDGAFGNFDHGGVAVEDSAIRERLLTAIPEEKSTGAVYTRSLRGSDCVHAWTPCRTAHAGRPVELYHGRIAGVRRSRADPFPWSQ